MVDGPASDLVGNPGGVHVDPSRDVVGCATRRLAPLSPQHHDDHEQKAGAEPDDARSTPEKLIAVELLVGMGCRMQGSAGSKKTPEGAG